jgi:hypothetical protein
MATTEHDGSPYERVVVDSSVVVVGDATGLPRAKTEAANRANRANTSVTVSLRSSSRIINNDQTTIQSLGLHAILVLWFLVHFPVISISAYNDFFIRKWFPSRCFRFGLRSCAAPILMHETRLRYSPLRGSEACSRLSSSFS